MQVVGSFNKEMFIMNYRDEVRDSTREGVWTFWHLLPRLLLAFAVLGAIGFGWMLLSRPAAIVTRVTDPDRIIQNYEWFEESYNDALALDRKIGAAAQQIESQFGELPSDRNDWARSDRDEYNRLNAVLLGLRSQRESIVADYNAHSKMITRSLWKDAALPYQLSIEDDGVKEIWVK